MALRFCHEAGACGCGVHRRQLRRLGADCLVVAPSMAPLRPGGRARTDRRDAMTLARLLRAGELAAVWVPDEEHEALRDLARARRQAEDDLVSAKLALRGFPLRHERRFPGRSAWHKTYRRWLGEQAFASPHQRLVSGGPGSCGTSRVGPGPLRPSELGRFHIHPLSGEGARNSTAGGRCLSAARGCAVKAVPTRAGRHPVPQPSAGWCSVPLSGLRRGCGQRRQTGHGLPTVARVPFVAGVFFAHRSPQLW